MVDALDGGLDDLAEPTATRARPHVGSVTEPA